MDGEDAGVKVKRRKIGKPNPGMGGRGDATPLLGLNSLVHVTSVGAAREIVGDHAIGIQHCKVFGRDLAYFFLGRAAYRLRDGDQKSRYISMFPAAFVADASVLPPPFHVYPCDTGALMGGVFGDRPNPHIFLEDYELEPSIKGAQAHVQWAFGDGQAYLDGDLRVDLGNALPQWDEVGHAFVALASLASRQTSNQPDLRASSVEVAFDRPVPLKSAVGYAVLPKQYLEDSSGLNRPFLGQLEAMGVKWACYDWQPNLRPNDFSDDITRLVSEYMSSAEK